MVRIIIACKIFVWMINKVNAAAEENALLTKLSRSCHVNVLVNSLMSLGVLSVCAVTYCMKIRVFLTCVATVSMNFASTKTKHLGVLAMTHVIQSICVAAKMSSLMQKIV